MTEEYKEVTIEEFMTWLKAHYTPEQRKKLKLYIASDEELNEIFKKFYVDEEDGYIVLAGLSGTELD
jgi:intergrase/recombinase